VETVKMTSMILSEVVLLFGMFLIMMYAMNE